MGPERKLHRGYGNPRLVAVLAKLYSKLYGVSVDANNQVRVPHGMS